MNRRGFMKLLALTPLAGFIKPKQPDERILDERIFLTNKTDPVQGWPQSVKWSHVSDPKDWNPSGRIIKRFGYLKPNTEPYREGGANKDIVLKEINL